MESTCQQELLRTTVVVVVVLVLGIRSNYLQSACGHHGGSDLLGINPCVPNYYPECYHRALSNATGFAIYDT